MGSMLRQGASGHAEPRAVCTGSSLEGVRWAPEQTSLASQHPAGPSCRDRPCPAFHTRAGLELCNPNNLPSFLGLVQEPESS